MTTRVPYSSATSEPCIVQLRACRLPSVLRHIAVHGWFTVYEPATKTWHRWEVWQRREAGGTHWGHVYRDLMPLDRAVGYGHSYIVQEWQGPEAERIVAVLQKPESYPYRERYYAWPGPNSNTYIAWTLRKAQVEVVLSPTSIGKDYLYRHGVGVRWRKSGVQFASPLLGFKIDRSSCIEIHLLCLTFALYRDPLAVVTPFHRLELGAVRNRLVSRFGRFSRQAQQEFQNHFAETAAGERGGEQF